MKQGGTAKLKLSPLIGARAFLFSCMQKKRGGGCVESDLIDLGGKAVSLAVKQKWIVTDCLFAVK
jgi:hypothetical protein